MAGILRLIELPFDPPTPKTLPWNETYEKWIGRPVAFKIQYITTHEGCIFLKKWGIVEWVIDRTTGKSDGSFLYTLHIVSIALSLTIRQQLAIECLRR